MCKNIKQFEKYAQQTKDLYVRQFDDWKKQNMIPIINNRNHLFDVNTRDEQITNIKTNDILFSRLVADTNYIPTVFSTEIPQSLAGMKPGIEHEPYKQQLVYEQPSFKNNIPMYNLFNDNLISPLSNNHTSEHSLKQDQTPNQQNDKVTFEVQNPLI
jgi:hypothetical protein